MQCYAGKKNRTKMTIFHLCALVRIDGITGIPLTFPATLPEGNNFLVEDVLISSWRIRSAGPESNFWFFSS
jgi:hypothetical protein